MVVCAHEQLNEVCILILINKCKEYIFILKKKNETLTFLKGKEIKQRKRDIL